MYAVLHYYVLIIFAFLKYYIHAYLSFYNFIGIQHNRKRSVIE